MKFSDDQIQQLKEIVRTEVKEVVRTEVKEIVHTEIKSELKPIKRTLSAIRKDLSWTMLKYDTRLCSLEQHTTHPPQQIDFSLAI